MTTRSIYHLPRDNVTKISYCETYVKNTNYIRNINLMIISRYLKKNIIFCSLLEDDVQVNTSTLNWQHRRICKTSTKQKRIQYTHCVEYFKCINDVWLFVQYTIHKKISFLKLHNIKFIETVQMTNKD